MSRVVLVGLTKIFAAAPAVAGVELEIAAGEVVVVLGANGSGKTTLLRLIAGLDRPTRGTIRIADKEVTHLPPHERSVGLVFQDAVLEPEWSVRQHLAFPLSVGRGASGVKDREVRIRETAAELGIEEWLDRSVGELSGGQQQRVAIGRAMIRRPAILLLDEPLANLDPAGRWELRRQLRPWLAARGTTAVHVTHDAVEAQCLADRVAVLEKGELLQVATPDVLRQEPACLKVLQAPATWPVNVVELPEIGLTLAVNAPDVRLTVEGGNNDWPPARVSRVSRVGGEWLTEFRWRLPAGRETAWWTLGAGDARLDAGQTVQVEIAETNQHWFESATARRATAARGQTWLASKRGSWEGGET